MRLKKNPANTYLDIIDAVYYNSEEVDFQFINQLLENFKQVALGMPFTAPVFFIVDYTKANYLCVSESVRTHVQYSPQEFMEGGISFLIHIYHPDDFKVYNEHIFTKNANFLKTVDQSEHSQYVFSYTWRVKTAKKEYITINQRSTLLTSRVTGLPLYGIGMGVDVSNFKRDTVMYHSIEKFPIKNNLFEKEIVEQNYFYPNFEDTLLTKREIEILKSMVDGLSSKDLANKFHVSEYTIFNHRKNMLKKTNTKNVAQLVGYVLKNRII